MSLTVLFGFYCRFNYHLEKVRDIVNNAFSNLFPVDEPLPEMEYGSKRLKLEEQMEIDLVDPSDRLMCEIADEIPF